jgi:hypothetical protein
MNPRYRSQIRPGRYGNLEGGKGLYYYYLQRLEGGAGGAAGGAAKGGFGK